jgi:hypothetical protein
MIASNLCAVGNGSKNLRVCCYSRVRVKVGPRVRFPVLLDASNVTRLDYINIPPQLQLCKCPNLLGHRKVNEDLLATTADYHDTQIT